MRDIYKDMDAIAVAAKARLCVHPGMSPSLAPVQMNTINAAFRADKKPALASITCDHLRPISAKP